MSHALSSRLGFSLTFLDRAQDCPSRNAGGGFASFGGGQSSPAVLLRPVMRPIVIKVIRMMPVRASLLLALSMAGCVPVASPAPALHGARRWAFDATLGYPGEGPPSSAGPPRWSPQEWERQLSRLEGLPLRGDFHRERMRVFLATRSPEWPRNGPEAWSPREADIHRRWLWLVLGEGTQQTRRQHNRALQHIRNSRRPPRSSRSRAGTSNAQQHGPSLSVPQPQATHRRATCRSKK